MLTSAPSHACTPALSSSRSVQPPSSNGTSTSRDKPPVQSASTNGEMIAARGEAARVIAAGALDAARVVTPPAFA